MLTIPVLAKVGPWTLLEVEQRSEPMRCERCDTAIREVWVCEVEPQEAVGVLQGKALWRIGNDCGPQLLAISTALWAKAGADGAWRILTKEAKRRLRYLKRLAIVNQVASTRAYDLPSVLRSGGERAQKVLTGTATDRELRHLGGVLTTHELRLGIKKRPSSSQG